MRDDGRIVAVAVEETVAGLSAMTIRRTVIGTEGYDHLKLQSSLPWFAGRSERAGARTVGMMVVRTVVGSSANGCSRGCGGTVWITAGGAGSRPGRGRKRLIDGGGIVRHNDPPIVRDSRSHWIADGVGAHSHPIITPTLIVLHYSPSCPQPAAVAVVFIFA